MQSRSIAGLPYFYPRPPRGGRPDDVIAQVWAEAFLSTPSARRATCDASLGQATVFVFLSTPSARRATHKGPAGYYADRGISIHALREEGDGCHQFSPPAIPYFYPRPPRGGRRLQLCRLHRSAQFLSTPSARRATTNAAASRSLLIFLSTPSARRATTPPG